MIADSFKSFMNRVIHAARMGRLGERDIIALKHLLTKTGKKNLVLSRALLTAFSGGEESEADVKRFAHLLDLANRRIMDGKDPFSIEEKKELEGLFKKHSLSSGAARKFALGLDELLAMELRSQMEREVPQQKKTEQVPQFQKPEEKQKLTH